MNVRSSENKSESESRLALWLSYLVLLGGLGAAIAATYLVISTYSSLPYWDEWALFDQLARGKTWSFPWLWAQHNEHRILLPKIFFLIDVALFHGTQTFLLISIWLVQLLQVALLSSSLWMLGGMRGAAWRTGTGLIAFCILCPTQYENLIWGFQLGFVIPAAMATLSILSQLLLHRRSAQAVVSRSWALLLLCIASATAATWSLANGMLLWPLLLFTALLLGMRRSTVLALLLSGVVNIGLYFYGYHSPSPQSGPAWSLHALGRIADYVTVYFGSTFFRHSSGRAAVVAGIAGLCAALAIIVRVLQQRGSGSLLLLQLSLLMLFCIATAAITASGRLHLGLEQASASRYQTFALIFWCSLGLALLFDVTRAGATNRGLTALCGFLLVLMLGFATQVRLPLIDAEWHQLQLRLISLALLTGVHDPAVLAEAFPDPRVVLRDAEYMKQNRLSIFAGKLYAQLGQPLDSVYKSDSPDACSGYATSSQILPADEEQGLRIRGFAWNRELGRPATRVVAAVGGRIAGFGSTVAIPLNSANAGPNADAARFGWLGFVRGVSPGDKIKLYVSMGNNAESVCPFAETSL